MEKNSINISISSKFIGKTSSRDKKTNFYGMMSETNHKTPNGYNFLHNPGLFSIGEMDIAFVNMGHIQHIFEDELFDSLKKKANEITLSPVIIPVFFMVFYLIQTIKRCHDVGESGWRFLIPIYSPSFLLFLPAEIEVDQEPLKPSILMTIWNSKWLILTLLLICLVMYQENHRNIQIHNAL